MNKELVDGLTSFKKTGRNGDSTNKWIGAKFDTDDEVDAEYVEAFNRIQKRSGGGLKETIAFMIAHVDNGQ